MSSRKIISVFFTFAVLSAAAACAGSEISARESQAAAVSTVNEFYDVIEDEKSYSDIASLQAKYQNLTKEEKLQKVATEVRGMEYFDISSEEHIIDAYLMLAGGIETSQELRAASSVGSDGEGEVKITIPPTAVVVDGDTAVVDLAKGTLEVNGVASAKSTSSGNFTLKMTRNNNGKWILNPVE